MTHYRKPLWLAGRIVSAALILTLFPLAAAQAAPACSQTVYWYGSNMDVATSLYHWDKEAPGITNWVDQQTKPTPQVLLADARVIFPDWAVNKHATNDFAVDKDGNGLLVYDMTFQDTTGYTVDGNPLQLNSGITVTSLAGANAIAADLELMADQTFQLAGATSSLTLSGALSDVYGKAASGALSPATTPPTLTLTKDGPGSLALTSNLNTFTGAIKVLAGTLFIGNHVTSSNLSFKSGGTGITLSAKITSPTDYSQAIVTGPTSYVKLNNAALVLETLPQPMGKQTYTLIDNQGPNAVVGTFLGISEGSVIHTTDGRMYTISYKGGDGNDVVLTPVWLHVYSGLVHQNFASPEPIE
jgi:autotransporter-associated beta strand protein